MGVLPLELYKTLFVLDKVYQQLPFNNLRIDMNSSVLVG